MIDNKFEKHCSLCGNPGPFKSYSPASSLRESYCENCRASRRNRDLAQGILRIFADEKASCLQKELHKLESLKILELEARGPLHNILKVLPGYLCSEFIPGVPEGSKSAEGVLCEDITSFSFASESFDLVISQDILEHLAKPCLALAEVRRVLKKQGRHLFTVPIHEGRKSSQRIKVDSEGNHDFLSWPLYHGDPLRDEGSLVFWDFGYDFIKLCKDEDLKILSYEKFYEADEVFFIKNKADYERYKRLVEQKRRSEIFYYNSYVFLQEKLPA